MQTVDVNRYQRILESYPSQEFSNYVRLRLAGSMVFKQPDKAADLLVQLRERAASFWPMETGMLLAHALINQQRHADALETVEGLLARDANLRSNYTFMQMYLTCRYPHARKNPVTQWRENRLRGVERPEEHILLE